MALSSNILKFFASFIQAELGIIYDEQNFYQLEKRLEDVAKAMEIPEGPDRVMQLYKMAQPGISGNLKQLLLNISTNNETSFFRDPKVFKAFEEVILPSFQKRDPHAKSYRIWSAASSYGQEPYSLAILVNEFLNKNVTHQRIEILGTDIADHALSKAKAGIYSQLEIQRGLPAPLLVKYFKNDTETTWALSQEIKHRVQYTKLNLLESFVSMGTFDTIFCRYVLIYQEPKMKKEIIGKLAKCLVPGGYLILGATETVFGLSDEFTQISANGVILYMKK